jgi:ribonuclease BN (tRNA processing enzyme)
VSSGGTRIWVDAGSGTLDPPQGDVRPDELDAIWIAHMHADHSADLLTAYYGALYADISLAAPIPLYGPVGIASPPSWPDSVKSVMDRLPDQHTRSAVRSSLPSRSRSYVTGSRRGSARSSSPAGR